MRTLDEVLGALAVPGVDHDGVTDYLLGAIGERRRTRHRLLLGGLAAVMAAAVAVAFAIPGQGPDDEVVADRESAQRDRGPTTTTADAFDSEVAAQTSTSLPTVTTVPLRVPTLVPRMPSSGPSFSIPRFGTPGGQSSATTAPPAPVTTAPVDRPLTASLTPVDAAPKVGDVATFRVSWSDPDLPADAQPVAWLQTGDAVNTPQINAEAAGCSGGGARTGTIDKATRYSRPGTYTVTAVVSACGHNALVSTQVTVAPADGTPLVLTGPTSPEDGTVSYRVGADGPWTPLPRQPGLALFFNNRAATVVVLPEGATHVQLEVAGCTQSGDVAAATGDPKSLHLAC